MTGCLFQHGVVIRSWDTTRCRNWRRYAGYRSAYSHLPLHAPRPKCEKAKNLNLRNGAPNGVVYRSIQNKTPPKNQDHPDD